MSDRLLTDADEIVVVLAGSGGCGACMSSPMKGLADTLRRRLIAPLATRGLRVTMLGIALDADPRAGNAYLVHTGPFDEAATGRGWENTLYHRIVGVHVNNALRTPALLLFARRIEHAGGNIVVRDQPPVLFRFGLDSIAQLTGMPTFVDSVASVISREVVGR